MKYKNYMNYLKTFFLIGLMLTVYSCKNGNEIEENMKPAKVELGMVDGKHRMIVNDKPFFVEGAGVDDGDIAALASHGANSFRTWMDSPVHIPADEVLRLARENDLMVMMGLNVARERHGFDYDDEEAVLLQFERIKEKVLSMKDHPNLLGWGIGNELNLDYTNKKVWDAVDQIAAFIHEVDGNHPTTTMLAGIGKEEVDYIRENCPNIDFLSIQMYGDIVNLEQRIKDAGYEGPYLVTEWGATGHWEVAKTSWEAPIENTTSEKARDIKERYENVILADTTHCLGSYVFLWGQKQERTPTWYGLFTEQGNETEAIDVMHRFWTGSWPENRAPKIHNATLNGKTRYESVHLDAGKNYQVNYEFEDPDNDELTVEIDIMRESMDLKQGGDLENRPVSLNFELVSKTPSSAEFISPVERGAYRVFIYARDNHNNTAAVNIPFYVEEK